MTVYRLCSDGTLPSIRTGRTGRTIRIDADAFADYLASRTTGTAHCAGPVPVTPGQLTFPANEGAHG